MKVLFDHGTPAPLRNFLPGHDVDLAKERGLDTWANGKLLKAAEAEGYDVLVTTDKSLPFQQNLAGISYAIIIVPADWALVQQRLSLVQRAVEQTSRGRCVMVSETEIHPPRPKTKKAAPSGRKP